MRNFVKRKIGEWVAGKRSQKLMNLVGAKMTEVREKVRGSDSPFRGLARRCIDRAEDHYQEAIYNLKDGDADKCFEYCRKGLGHLKIAAFHLAAEKLAFKEPDFASGTAEAAILVLAKSIAMFKMGVEYYNCEVSKENRQQLVDVLSLFGESLTLLKQGADDMALRTAQAGSLSVYMLTRSFGEKLQSYLVNRAEIEQGSNTWCSRILDLADEIFEAEQLARDASPPAQPRIEGYLHAARSTFERSVQAYAEGDKHCIELVKAGKMEARMAKNLIESSSYAQFEVEELDDDCVLLEKIEAFKRRVARVQRLLRVHDPESNGAVRSLYQVSAYYAKSSRRLRSGELNEAERYARSAHLDVDYTRQLAQDGNASYSQII